MAVTTTAVRDKLVAEAQSLPELVATAAVLDPTLAASLTPKVLIASRTPLGVVLTAGLAWAAGHYGFGWNSELVDLVAGAAVLGASYAFRYISKQPIAGIVTPKAPV